MPNGENLFIKTKNKTQHTLGKCVCVRRNDQKNRGFFQNPKAHEIQQNQGEIEQRN